MYKCINGWTKERMKAQIRKYNNGKRATASSQSTTCDYTTSDGNHCAVGCFIPETHGVFTGTLKCSGDVFDLLDAFPELELVMPIEDRGLAALQLAHDRDSYSDMRELLCDWIDLYITD